jgi:hypothetical protein
VEQSLDRETNALQPGDAFARRIVFRAEDVQAMMLPAFDAEPLPGLASYPAPPQLNNSNNRGRTSASRSQTINYVAEKPGDYLLPARDYFWWDTRSASLEVLTLPAIEVHVAGEITPAAGAGGPRLDRQTGITIGASVLTALLLGWLAAHYRPWIMLAGLRPPLHRLGQRLQALRKPALAEKLNPDNSAGE